MAQTKTILIAEDDQMVRDMLGTALRLQGYSVLTAEDGEQAIGIFRQASQDISLAIVDHCMPNKTGYEVLREIHDLNQQTKVILSSGYFSNQDEPFRVDPEYAVFIHKPYRLPEMLKLVKEFT